MGSTFIGIKLSDGSYFPILESGKSSKKRLVLTASKDDQSRAVIQFFRGQGEKMENPASLGTMEISDLSSRFHDIEVILEENAPGKIDVRAGVVGGNRIEQIELDLESSTATSLNEGRTDADILDDDSLVEEGIDDFSLDPVSSSESFEQVDSENNEIFDSGTNEDALDSSFDLNEEDESLNLGDLDTPIDDVFKDQDEAPVASIQEENEIPEGDELSLNDLDFGEDSSGDELSSFEELDSDQELASDTSRSSSKKEIDDFSLDDLDNTLEDNSSLPADDFGLNENEDNFGESAGAEDIGGEGLSEAHDPFSMEDGGDSSTSEDDFGSGMNNFTMDNFGADEADDSPLGSLSGSDFGGQDVDWETDNQTSQIDDQAPVESESRVRTHTEKPEVAPVKVKPAKEKKQKEKRSVPKPQPSSSKSKSDKPDHLSLILGLVIFVPLALMLIVLVVLNMVRPVFRPPLGYRSGHPPAIVRMDNPEVAKVQLQTYLS